jgi:aspartate-semialdehyde dehydrogenase
MARPLKVAVLGATGAVGTTLVQVLEEHDFPVGSLRLLASERSEGAEIDFRGDALEVEVAKDGALDGQDVVFLAAPEGVAREWAPRARAAGCAVVDVSPAFRLEADVPLVVPEVNPQDVDLWKARGIVASPGPSSVLLAVALKPLHDAAGLEHVAATVLASVSGAGQAAIEQLEREGQDLMNGREPEPGEALPWRTAFNLVPQAGPFGPDGRTGEESAVGAEARRLLHDPGLRLSATVVRVPLFYGHSAAVSLRTRRALDADAAREALRAAPGVKVVDDPAGKVYPMPMLAVNDDAVLVGRLRADASQENGLALFAVLDNLRKGAASNAVQIARILADRHL